MNKTKNKKAFTFAETKNRHSEARSAEESIIKSDSSLPLRMTEHKAGFTLAETLITLTILGVIAAITVPGLVRRQVEAANRTKIKKAMRSYDLAINKMVVENGLKNDEALVNFAGKEENNCAGASNYFKISQGSGCVFKTSDGVWWNISDIQKTIIALNQNDLNKETADSDTNRAFYFFSWFDRNGTLRVNDLNVAQDNDRLQALYDYIYGKTKMSNAEVAQNPVAQFEKCKEENAQTCTVNGVEYNKAEWNDYTYDGSGCWMWYIENENGEDMCSFLSNNSKIESSVSYFADMGTGMTWDEGKAYCESQGMKLANTAQLQQLYRDGKLATNEYMSDAEIDEINPNYFTSELITGNYTNGASPREVVFFSARWEGVSVDAYKNDDCRVLCVGP